MRLPASDFSPATYRTRRRRWLQSRPTGRSHRVGWQRPVDAIAVSAIHGYQRHLSPRKGFSCAHRVVYGGDSCSQHIKQLITQEGMLTAMVLAPERFRACRRAYGVFKAQHRVSDSPSEPQRQRKIGDCLSCGSDFLCCGNDYDAGNGACLVCGCLEGANDIISGCD
jgi:putative component of membrane protein insertase Oxa1/YidC/SpoIIIJ protein YidD